MKRFPSYIFLTGVLLLVGNVASAADPSLGQLLGGFAPPDRAGDRLRDKETSACNRAAELNREKRKACGSSNSAQCMEKASDCASASGSYSIGGSMVNVLGQLGGVGNILNSDEGVEKYCYDGSRSEQKSEKDSLRSSMERMQEKAESTEDKLADLQKTTKENVAAIEKEMLDQQRDFNKEQRSARKGLQAEQDAMVEKARDLRKNITQQQSAIAKAQLALAAEQKKQVSMQAQIAKFAASSSSSVKCARDASDAISKIMKSPKAVSGTVGASNIATNKKNQIFKDMVEECLMMIQQQREDALSQINDKITNLTSEISAAQMEVQEAKGQLEENTLKLQRAAQEYRSEQVEAQQQLLLEQARLNTKKNLESSTAFEQASQLNQRLATQRMRAGETERKLNMASRGKTFGEVSSEEAYALARDAKAAEDECARLTLRSESYFEKKPQPSSGSATSSQ